MPFPNFCYKQQCIEYKKAISWKLYEFISLYTSIRVFSDLGIRYGGHKTGPSMTVITLYLTYQYFTITQLYNTEFDQFMTTISIYDFYFI